MATLTDLARRIQFLTDRGEAEPLLLECMALDVVVLASEAFLSGLDPSLDPETFIRRSLPESANTLIQALVLQFGEPKTHQLPLQATAAHNYLADVTCIRAFLDDLSQRFLQGPQDSEHLSAVTVLRLLNLSVRGLQAKYELDFQSAEFSSNV